MFIPIALGVLWSVAIFCTLLGIFTWNPEIFQRPKYLVVIGLLAFAGSIIVLMKYADAINGAPL